MTHPRRPLLALPGFLLTLLLTGCGQESGAPALDSADELDPARRRILMTEPGPRLAPVRVVVGVHEGVDPWELAASYEAAVIDELPEVRAYVLGPPPQGTESSFVHRLGTDPRIAFVEPDAPAQTAEGRQSTMAFSEGFRDWSQVSGQWALERIGAAEAHATATGSGVLVAVLDTGADLDHPDLEPALEEPAIEFGEIATPGEDRPQGVDTNRDGIVDGALGHGTHVAGLVRAAAPGARILAVRVLDSDGVGSAFSIARGIVAATLRGANVINLSLGMDTPSEAIRSAIEFARGAGAIVVAPAGNGGSSTLEYPAAFPGVLAVAGTDDLDRKAAFSNYGAAVFIAAPAVGLLSAYSGGGHATWSGTSMAAPLVSGAVALVLELRGGASMATALDVESALESAAVPLDDSDPVYGDGDLGAGRLQLPAATPVVEGEGAIRSRLVLDGP